MNQDILGLSGKTVLVAGVADNASFAWYIAKALQNVGAEVILSCHPRIESILARFITKEKYQESRMLDHGGEFTPKLIIPCDLGDDDSILELKNRLEIENISLSAVIHSVAFSPEIQKSHIEVSRNGYLTAMSISSYSLIALCQNLLPLFHKAGASVIALSYLASERAVPMYGGAMASAKAALECDARMLSWTLGQAGHRINIISPGPYASRAAKSVGDIETMIELTKAKSPLKRAITPKDVANTCLFLASHLSSAITGETIHVDAGFHAMGLV